MKAADFDYAKPCSLPELFALLHEHGDEARMLAGGQSLLPTLNMRLSEPGIVIDLAGIQALHGLTVTDSVLRIGALVTHSEIEASPLVAQHAPLLAMAVRHIAHRAIRNRGTFGGSIAHADPAAEWPACLLALEGTVVALSRTGQRRIAARDFFVDLYTTALSEGEVIMACEIALRQADDWFGFDELARRQGDYGIVGLAAAARRIPADDLTRAPTRWHRWRLALLGVAATPIRATGAEAVLEGQTLTAETLERAVEQLCSELNPLSDLNNTAATKRHLAGVLLKRMLTAAAQGAIENAHQTNQASKSASR